MEILAFGPDDHDALADHTAVVNAARAVDSPWMPPRSLRGAEGLLRWGWERNPATPYVVRDGGEAVAAGEVAVSPYDNRHLAWLDVAVHPDHRRRGHGSALLEQLLVDVGADGRTSVGLSGFEADATRAFAAAHGFALRSTEIVRRQVVADLDHERLRTLRAHAEGAAGDYDLLRRQGPLPAEELDAVAAMVAAINDAPTDDLDVEDEVYDARRVRAYEEAHAARGVALYRVQARHRASGELAGESVVAVDPDQPAEAEQHGTQVLRAHRGHRLGMLLKLEALAWVREAEPQVRSIDTWNAESNEHMIGVNEALGYRWLAREWSFQRSLA